MATLQPTVSGVYITRINKLNYTQGRIIHCAGCTMGGAPPPSQGGPADQLPNFYRTVLTFERSMYA